ncbi:ATP-grasp domain-containing protein [Desulfovibrionales bacterium]
MATSKGRVNLLFTSAGRRVELLQAFRRALKNLSLAGRIVATDMDPLAPALRIADAAYLVPRVVEPEFIPRLATIIRNEAIDLIFPCIDPDIPVLCTHRQELEAEGGLVVVSNPVLVAAGADKYLTWKLFHDLGLPTPNTWLPQELKQLPTHTQLAFPLFMKPRYGSASQDTRRIHNAAELAFYLPRTQEPMLQEYLPGPEVTCDVVCDLNGQVLGICQRQRIEIRCGDVAKAVTVHDPAIHASCLFLAEIMRPIGPITVQWLYRDKVAHCIEINCRFGGGIPLAFAAGMDIPSWLLTQAAKLPLELQPTDAYKRGLYLTRCDESFFVTETDLKLSTGGSDIPTISDYF